MRNVYFKAHKKISRNLFGARIFALDSGAQGPYLQVLQPQDALNPLAIRLFLAWTDQSHYASAIFRRKFNAAKIHLVLMDSPLYSRLYSVV